MFMRWRRRLCCLLLAACTVLTGCRAAPSDVPHADSGASNTAAAAMQSVTVESGMAQEVSWAYAWRLADGLLWACGSGPVGWGLVSQRPDGGGCHCQPLTLPQVSPPQGAALFAQEISDFCFAADGTVWMLQTDYFSFPAGEQEDGEGISLQNDWSLCRLGPDGVLERVFLLTAQLPPLWQNAQLLPVSGSLQCTADGGFGLLAGLQQPESADWQAAWLAVSAEGAVTVQLLPQGTQLLPLYGMAQPLADGSTAYVSDNTVFVTAAGQLPTAHSGGAARQGGVWGVAASPADPAGQLVYWNSNSLCRLSLADDSEELLLRWADHDLKADALCAVFALEDGRVLAVTQSEEKAYLFHLLTPGDGAAAEGPVVTLGVLGYQSDSIRRLVSRYNAGAPTVPVQTVDYSDAAAQAAGFASGTEMLYNHVLQGGAPDILLLPPDMENQNLIGKGVLTDLYPLLDADPELQRSDFLPGLLAACEVEGALPTVVPAFQLSGAVCRTQTASASQKWDMEAFSQALAAAPQVTEPFYGTGRALALLQLVRQGGTAYLDYEAGVCHLDSPSFVQLLTASAAWPEAALDINADPKQALTDGRALLRPVLLGSFQTLRQLRYEADGDFTFCGYPGEKHAAFLPTLQLGITAQCADPEAAWQFVRCCLAPDFQQELALDAAWYSFPARLDSLQTALQAAQEQQRTPRLPTYLSAEELTPAQQEYWRQGVLPADADALLACLAQTDTLDRADTAVTDILLEEAAAFYSGAHTAAQTAALLQDRVQNYLAEQH